MRNLIRVLHLGGAVGAGLFLIVLGVTGAIMAFEDDLDRFFNPRLFTVAPGHPPMPVSAVLATLRHDHPGERFRRLQLPAGPDAPYSAQVGTQQIFFDGGTGTLIGTRVVPTPFSRIHQFHTSLLVGRPGSVTLGVAAVVLVFLLGSGVYLWWPRKRIAIDPRRPTSLDLHQALGIWSAPVIAALAASGILIAFGDTVIPWINAASGSSPPPRDLPSRPGSTPPISADDAIRQARAALPGAVPLALSSPVDARSSYNVAMRFPEDLTPGGRSWVIVDQYSGAPLFIEDARHPPAGAGVATFNRAVHTGDLLGYAGKTTVSLASLALVVQVITGLQLWWRRRRRRVDAARVQGA